MATGRFWYIVVVLNAAALGQVRMPPFSHDGEESMSCGAAMPFRSRVFGPEPLDFLSFVCKQSL